MKVIIVALALVALAAAGPVPEYPEPIKILRSEYDLQPEGPYNFSFETENGILRNEEAILKQGLDEENEPYNFLDVRGSYSYPNAEGKPEAITYWADETGYHAEGDSIPKAVSRR